MREAQSLERAAAATLSRCSPTARRYASTTRAASIRFGRHPHGAVSSSPAAPDNSSELVIKRRERQARAAERRLIVHVVAVFTGQATHETNHAAERPLRAHPHVVTE